MSTADLTALRLADARRRLSRLRDDTLSDAAIDALSAGLDSPALRRLAVSADEDTVEKTRLFDAVLRELGVQPLDTDAALQAYVRHLSKKIVDGAMDPYKGAKEIWSVLLDSGSATHEYDPFVYAASEYEDRIADREMFSNAIVDEARRQLERT